MSLNISTSMQKIWYCICDALYTYHPMWMPHSFFELSSSHLSRYWIFSFKKDLQKNRFFLGFPEWASQQDFYDNLTDGEDREVAIFKAYKELMDLEFPDSSISEAAQIGDGEWLICPTCIDAWQSCNSYDALVKCPECRKKNKQPSL